MKNVKRFQIQTDVAFLEDDLEPNCLMTITDLDEIYANAFDGGNVAEIQFEDKDDNYARAQITLENLDAIIEVLTHIKSKVLATKKEEKDGKPEKTF